MNFETLVFALAKIPDSSLRRTMLALVRVAIMANACDHDCPDHRGPCDCQQIALEFAVGNLKAIAGPISLPGESP